MPKTPQYFRLVHKTLTDILIVQTELKHVLAPIEGLRIISMTLHPRGGVSLMIETESEKVTKDMIAIVTKSEFRLII